MSENNSCSIPHSGSDRVHKSYFDKSRKSDYLVLIPDMLPIHFKLIMAIYEQYGYRMELLQTSTRSVIDEGLKNVHNDTCYPALLVIGQFMDALKSGKYDPDHTALLISQTGGGCRACWNTPGTTCTSPGAPLSCCPSASASTGGIRWNSNT